MERSLMLVATGVLLMAGTGTGALFLSRWPRVAGGVSAGGVVLGALMGIAPAAWVLAGGEMAAARADWPLPVGGLVIGLDALSAFFLIPTLVLGAAAAVYGSQYMQAYASTRHLGIPFFGFNLLVACVALVVLARNAVTFLIAWETMAVAAGLLVAYEHEKKTAVRAGWLYLVVSHFGVMAIMVVFLLFKARAGSLDFEDFARNPPTGGAAAAVAILALAGFGSKAGLVPLHMWLPEAHAAAPSHVSAMMSGVLIKVGLYGVLRVFVLLGTRADWWGPVLAGLGLSSALVAIALAIYQRDLKRALAYSSVENVGLICLALGMAYWAASRGLPRVAALGVAGGLLHLWNHVLMKGGMFLVAGSILHGTGTRNLERMGGLARRMPLTAAGMTLGALALSALPPLNGFVSEWLMYLGLMHLGVDGRGSLVALLGVGVLALVGGLAALSFVRLLGVAMLGQARSPEAAHAHESGKGMLGPIFLLAGCSLAVALAPALAVSAQAAVGAQLLGPQLAALDPADHASLVTLGTINLGLVGALAAAGLIYRRVVHRRPVREEDTWGCGYPAPVARMQYGARSFAELTSEQVLPAALAPVVTQPMPAGLFPTEVTLSTDDSDPVMRGAYQPVVLRLVGWASSFSWLQRGLLQSYLSYVLLALVLALGWASVRDGGLP